MKRSVFIITCLLLANLCQARKIIVDDEGPADFNNIQAAIDDSNDGDIIEVQLGVYTGPGNRDIDFKGKAITVKSTNPYDPAIVAATVIDCQNSGRGFSFHNGEGYNSILTGLTITNGRAEKGGAIFCLGSSPTISHCIITKNSAPYSNSNGGGISCNTSNSIISHCIISNNSCTNGNGWGGGIYCYSGNVTLKHCILIENAAWKGGGIYSNYSNPKINHCIIWGNTARYGPPQIGKGSTMSGVTVRYSNVEGGWSGEGNIDADPLFVDPAFNDYHLLPNSPCINAGDPAYELVLGDLDIDGDPLLAQGRIDIGADEFCSETNYVELTETTVRFYAFEDSNDPEPQIVYLLKNIRGSFLWDVSGNCPWLDVNPRNGEISSFSDKIVLNVDASGLSRGIYTCELTITAHGAVNSPMTLNVILHILNEGQYYVPSDFQTIQDAIDWATEGDTVIVMPGIYTGLGNKNLDFGGKAITVRSIDPNDPNITASTVIDCEAFGRGFYFHNGETPFSVLAGLTITNGHTTLGGGIFCENSSPTIKNCSITGNAVSGNESGGGGLCLKGSNAKIVNCKVINNSISGTNTKGGGIYCLSGSPTIQNCIIAKNKTPVWGGGIYGAPFINHCTIVGNSASHSGGGIEGNSQVNQSIVWNNIAPRRAEISAYHYSDVSVSYSDVRGGRPGPGNIDADPCLVDPEGGDYHLSHDSPCIDSGDPEYTGESEEADIDGDNRLINRRVDIGADEVSYMQPFIGVSLDKCLFFALEGAASPDDQILSIMNVGSGRLKWKINEESAWLEALPQTGISAGELDEIIIRVDSHTLSEGIYSSELLIHAKDALNGPLKVPVILCVYPYVDSELLVPIEYETIQSAIDDASDGDIVVVTPGIYTGDGNRDLDFQGKAITVRSIDPLDEVVITSTVIDCKGRINDPHRGFRFSNGESYDSILEGFTITNGLAPRDYCFEWRGRTICLRAGGGILCEDSNPTIRHCVITRNTVIEGRGGGIFCARSSPVITHCKITRNWVEITSGGIRCDEGSYPFISNCVIANNRAFTHDSGGIGFYDSWLDIDHCTVVNNSPQGIYNYHSVSGATISNSIFWGNGGAEISGKGFEVSYSDIEGGYPGIDNIDLDPLFFDIANYDYHLLSNSPCIDAGDPNYIPEPNETDLDGNPRVIENRTDIGAYESNYIEVALKFTPQTLNPKSKGKWIKAHVVLPEDFDVNDVDVNSPAKLWPLSIESDYIDAFINEDELVEIEIGFNKSAFCDARIDNSHVEVIVIGRLTSGQDFYGEDTIRILNKNSEYLFILTSHWLEQGCDSPDWCEGTDISQDGMVNFVDFAMFNGYRFEVVGK